MSHLQSSTHDNYTHSLPALQSLTHSLQKPSLPSPPSSPKKPQTTTRGPTLSQLSTRHPSASAHSWSHLSQTHDWPKSNSIDSSLDLPLSLKETLKEVLGKEAWPPSSSSSYLTSSSVSSFPVEVNHSWLGRATVETTETSDLSFNPLTYMVDDGDRGHLPSDVSSAREEGSEGLGESRTGSVATLVVEKEEEMDMSSLTGMLKFVNQTLAMQDDPSLWSSVGSSKT